MHLEKITVPNLGDHRIAMSTFILAVLTGAKAKIKILRLFLPLHHLFKNYQIIWSKF